MHGSFRMKSEDAVGWAKCTEWEMRNKKEEERKEKGSADRKTDV
jgi:hypothetical protein